VCGTIALIIFGSLGDGRDFMPDWEQNYLSWSFGLGKSLDTQDLDIIFSYLPLHFRYDWILHSTKYGILTYVEYRAVSASSKY
jgi:hypothetical protein